MKALLAVSSAVLFTGATLSAAEDNEDLLQPSYIGATTENEEYDTFGYDTGIASDLDIRFNTGCSGLSCSETGGNLAGKGEYIGEETGRGEKDTFGYRQ